MRGTIEVTGEGDGETAVDQSISPPLYVELELDIDAPHTVDVLLDNLPSATRGETLNADIPSSYLSRDVYLTQPPFEVWQALRLEPETAALTDNDLWDLVAAIWQSQTTDEKLQLGQTLYNQNCAACHGNTGAGDGVFGQEFDQATDFTDAEIMLGASTAVFDGKIRRGGMGTGMPYWGTIFTDYEIEAIIDYLWTFQFSRE
jgi:mono/diheme cytochrome c family protein